jgi:hypothetical protein
VTDGTIETGISMWPRVVERVLQRDLERVSESTYRWSIT